MNLNIKLSNQMDSKKYKIWVIVCITILTFTTGCEVIITKNQYYGYPDNIEKLPPQKQMNIQYQSQATNTVNNGENR